MAHYIDKDALVAEINRVLNSYDPNEITSGRYALGKILSFIDTLPEEPKKQPKFKIGDTIKGPYNNTFRVKDVLDTQYLLQSENGDELNSIEIVDKYSCLEEPTSDDLEKAAVSVIKKLGGMEPDDNVSYHEVKIFKAGAEWQKQQMMKDAVECTVHQCEVNGIKLDGVEILSDGLILDEKVYKDGDKVKIIIVKED